MFFQMTGADPAVLALSAVALALVALSAGFIPAHRASRVDPMRALKYENSFSENAGWATHRRVDPVEQLEWAGAAVGDDSHSRPFPRC